MKITNYYGIRKTTEIGLKFKTDEEVFHFFDRNGLNFNYLREISFGKDRRHPIQKIPTVISVRDSYEYFHDKLTWKYKPVMNKRLPVVCHIFRECQYKEYELLVEFLPILTSYKEAQRKYNLLRPIGDVYEYTGIMVTIKNPNTENGKPVPLHVSYTLPLICSIVSYNLEHYAIEDDGSNEDVDDDE